MKLMVMVVGALALAIPSIGFASPTTSPAPICPMDLPAPKQEACQTALASGVWEEWVCESNGTLRTSSGWNSCLASAEKARADLEQQTLDQQQAAIDSESARLQAIRQAQSDAKRQQALETIRLGLQMMIGGGGQPPSTLTQTYVIKGRLITCNTTGTLTSCN